MNIPVTPESNPDTVRKFYHRLSIVVSDIEKIAAASRFIEIYSGNPLSNYAKGKIRKFLRRSESYYLDVSRQGSYSPIRIRSYSPNSYNKILIF